MMHFIGGLLILVISSAFILLILPVNIYLIFACLVICFMASVYYGIKQNSFPVFSISIKHMWIEGSITILLMNDFYARWMNSNSSAISRLSGLLHLSNGNLIIITSIILGLPGFFFLNLCINKLEKRVSSDFKLNSLIQNHKYLGLVCSILILEYLMLEISALYTIEATLKQGICAFIVNIAFIVILNLILHFVLRKQRLSLIISSLLIFTWSVVNYYTIQFHGSPLFPSELVNIRTAAAVVSNYKYRMSFPVLAVIVLLVNIIILIYLLPLKGEIHSFGVKHYLFITILSVFVAVSGSYLLISHIYEDWLPWDSVIKLMGYNVSAVNDLKHSFNIIKKPDGYDDEYIIKYQNEDAKSDHKENSNKDNENVDIILILNESFYDLNYYSFLSTDIDYMQDYYNIKDATFGYAICPTVGGGTNTSEFELLSSKSTYLLSRPAPYTYLDGNIISRSVVNYLKSIGYKTTGMHCQNAANYSRNTAYPSAGFDNVFLGADYYKYFNKNGNRVWLDADNYKDLIDYYDVNSDSPQFMYLLTYQNHGGWEQNDDSLDTVHISNDYGSLTDDINEFLSSVQLSAKAISDLTEYFSKVDRNVIICMVGDHAPPFISDLQKRSDLDIENDSINKRAVPYVIWSNYGAHYDGYTDYTSMTDLVPMILSAAELPLSTFYSDILNLHELIPIRTREGIGVDRNFEESIYPNDDKYYDDLTEYYYLEYNSLLEDKRYRSELFEFAE